MESMLGVAEVRLRGRVESLRARAYWPAPAPGAPALLVVFGATDAMCRTLCAREHVVLALPDTTQLHDAMLAVEWAAEHAFELGADADRLLVGGTGAGARIAAAVVQHAREQGWPPIAMVPIDDPLRF